MGLLNKRLLYFSGILAGIVNTSNHTKCISLNNQQCMTRPTFINLHLNEYDQGLRYYPFTIIIQGLRYYNILNDLSNNRVCVPNKTKDLILNVLNMVAGINGSRTLTNIYHAGVNGNLLVANVTRIKSGITINVNVSAKIKENTMSAKRFIFGILLHLVAKIANI